MSLAINYAAYNKNSIHAFFGSRIMQYEFYSRFRNSSRFEYTFYAYAGLSYGDPNTNVTISTGIGKGNEGIGVDEGTFIPTMLMGKIRVSKKISIFTENHFFANVSNKNWIDNLLNLSGGIRVHFNENKGSFGLAIFTFTDSDSPLPYFDFIFKFK